MDIQALERLAALRDSGAITEEEFRAAKAEALGARDAPQERAEDQFVLSEGPQRRQRKSDLEKHPWVGVVLGLAAVLFAGLLLIGWLSDGAGNTPPQTPYEVGQSIPTTSEISTRIKLVRPLPGSLFTKGSAATYVVVVFENENVGDRPLDGVRKPQPILVDSNGNKYDRDWGAEGEVGRATDVGGQFGLLETLTPGLPETAYVTFVVSSDLASQAGWAITFDKNDRVRVPVSLSAAG